MGRFNKSELGGPIGLTTDMHGFVLVADNGNHHVTVFDQDGVYVCHFGYDSEDDYFYGIAVSPNGNIYIVIDRKFESFLLNVCTYLVVV